MQYKKTKAPSSKALGLFKKNKFYNPVMQNPIE